MSGPSPDPITFACGCIPLGSIPDRWKRDSARRKGEYIRVHDLGLRDYLHILRRRKWIVILSVLLVPLVAVALSLRQSPLYRSSADVLLRYQTLPSTLSGITDPNSNAYFTDPVRSTDTQLQIAELPVLADRVIAALRRKGSPGGRRDRRASVRSGTPTSFGSPRRADRPRAAASRPSMPGSSRFTTSNSTRARSPAVTAWRSASRSCRPRAPPVSAALAALQTKADQLQTLLTLQTSTPSSSVPRRRCEGSPDPEEVCVDGGGTGPRARYRPRLPPRGVRYAAAFGRADRRCPEAADPCAGSGAVPAAPA